MNNRSKLRLSALAAALATTAVFAGAYAASEKEPQLTTTPYSATIVTEKEVVVTVPEQPVEANIVAPAPAPEPAPPVERVRLAPPVTPAASAEPPIEVTAQRLTLDERIQAQVIDVLARNPALSGRIGVESRDAVVTLTGYTTTPGQAWRAGRDARGVIGVRYVVNEIRPRVGAVVH